MSWRPDPRPDWVQAINDGGVLPLALDAERPLTVASLMGDVAVQLGVLPDDVRQDLGDAREPLDVVVKALNDTAKLTVFGTWFTRRFLVRLLAGRTQMAQLLRDDPQAAEERVKAPIIVAGAPRTGTTFLYGLLALDDAVRTPQGWELLYPSPPPTGDPADEAARVELAQMELSMPQLVSSKMLTIHRYSGRMHKECLSAMSFAFRSEEFISRYDVPDYVAWLQSNDVTPGYAMHRQVFQLLQRRLPTTRWLLKSPVHLNNLDTVFATYPDAKVIITHRDPMTVLASVTSLLATLRWAQSDDVDIAAIGAYHADLYTRSLNRLVELTQSGAVPNDQIVHIDHDELIADPTAVIASAYDRLGLTFSGAFSTVLERHLAKPREQSEPHTYDAADLGIDPTATRAALQPYCDRFGVG